MFIMLIYYSIVKQKRSSTIVRELTRWLEYFSGKSQMNVTRSPVLTDKCSKFSSATIDDKEMNRIKQRLPIEIIRGMIELINFVVFSFPNLMNKKEKLCQTMSREKVVLVPAASIVHYSNDFFSSFSPFLFSLSLTFSIFFSRSLLSIE